MDGFCFQTCFIVALIVLVPLVIIGSLGAIIKTIQAILHALFRRCKRCGGRRFDILVIDDTVTREVEEDSGYAEMPDRVLRDFPAEKRQWICKRCGTIVETRYRVLGQ